MHGDSAKILLLVRKILGRVGLISDVEARMGVAPIYAVLQTAA
ncbi:MAG: hypothetical protein JWO07_74 [Candidatus Saccharibacteria bacterium]|nr:hypothetical protein [Candidatus Saccharibacteria bacterium]